MIDVIRRGVAREAEHMEAAASRVAELLHAEGAALQHGPAREAKRREQRLAVSVVLAYVPG